MAKPYTHRLQVKNQQSLVVLVSAGDLTFDIDSNYSHNFAGLVYFNDANGDTPVTPSAGSATLTIKTANQPQGFQSIAAGALDATTISQADWDGNSLQANFSFSGITGATHVRAIVTGNQS